MTPAEKTVAEMQDEILDILDGHKFSEALSALVCSMADVIMETAEVEEVPFIFDNVLKHLAARCSEVGSYTGVDVDEAVRKFMEIRGHEH